VRKSLVDPNPDEAEIDKLRLQVEDAKSFCKFLEKENMSLKETIEKNINVASVVAKGENDETNPENQI